MARISSKANAKAIDSRFSWLSEDMALKLADIGPSNPITPERMAVFLKSLTPEQRIEFDASARKTNNSTAKQFLDVAAKR